jgi:NAD(P)H dehydrogenase (quinone)
MIAVTGSTGEIGGRVARRLAEAGLHQRLLVREVVRAPRLTGAVPAAVPSYADREAMTAALRGVETLFLVSARESADRVQQHFTAIDAAVDGGVERIVYTSFLAAAPDATFTFARDHFHTEQYIRATGLRFTFLRSSLYADFVPLLPGTDGVIRGPAGDGRVAVVVRDDIADVAAAVIAGGDHDGETYDVTGPEAITLAEAAAALGRATGRSISYEQETLEEAHASRASYGAADWEVEGWVTSYAAIATGEMDVVSDTVQRVAGHAPTSLATYLGSIQ